MTEIGEAMAGSGSSRWEEPHTDAVSEEAAGLDRAAGLSRGAKQVIREEASSILRALGEGGQKGTRERPNAGAVESLQAGDCGTYLIIGKDVVAREYTVLLKDADGQEVGVAKWPFDMKAGGREPRVAASVRELRRETPLAEWTQEMRDDWDESFLGEGQTATPHYSLQNNYLLATQP